MTRLSTLPIQPSERDLEDQPGSREELHRQARALTHATFGNRIFVRGVVEVSNFCRENCTYCGMRRDNRELARYRLEVDRLSEFLIESRPPAMTDINIQTGEDPRAVDEVVLPLIRQLKRHTPLGISVCLGTLNEAAYTSLQAEGSSIYIMKFEVADPDRYQAFSAPGNLAERLNHIRLLARLGWNVSSGFIAGLPGETSADRLRNLQLAHSLPLCGCSVSPFIPGAETTLADARPGSVERTLDCMAWMRIGRPDWVIPAVSALNLSQPGIGYRRGLRAGANLVTMNLTPESFRTDYLLYTRDRFVMTEDKVLSALESEGLEPSNTSLADHYAAARLGAAVSAAGSSHPASVPSTAGPA